MRTIPCLVLAAFSLSACGGDSGLGGVSGSKKLVDLTPAETLDLCHGMAHDYPTRTYQCTNGERTFGIDDSSCTDGSSFDELTPTCTATVGDVEDCYDTLFDLSSEEFCNLTALPAACSGVIACQGDAATRTVPDQRDWLMGYAASSR